MKVAILHDSNGGVEGKHVRLINRKKVINESRYSKWSQ